MARANVPGVASIRLLLLALLPLLPGCLPAGGGSAPSSPAAGILERTEGTASYYADNLEGRATASGEPYRGSDLTAAHRTWPFGTRVRLIEPRSGRSTTVRVNDRGPFRSDRVIDVSRRAAEELGMIRSGTIHLRLEVISWGPQ